MNLFSGNIVSYLYSGLGCQGSFKVNSVLSEKEMSNFLNFDPGPMKDRVSMNQGDRKAAFICPYCLIL